MTAARNEAAPASNMNGVDRVVSVLEALQARRVASLAEVARAAGLSEPTAHRYLSALSEHRLVARDPYTGAYRLGIKLFELGRNALPLPDPREAARPHLRALRDQFGETAEMAAHDGTRLIIIAVEEALHGVAKGARVGEPDRWHSTSLGKSILAELDAATARTILEASTLTRFTSRTLVDPDEVLASLTRVRASGFAMDDEESEIGLRCIGAVIDSGKGKPRYSISVSGPTYRITLESVDRVAAAVRDAAGAISQELVGGRKSAPLVTDRRAGTQQVIRD